MNMKIKFLASLLFAFSAYAGKAQQVQLNGMISDFKDANITFHYKKNKLPVTDTVAVKGGKFTWTADMPEPQKVFIMFPQRYFEFYAESGKLNMSGKADEIWAAKVSGSKLQDEADAYRQSLKNITDQEEELYKQYGKGTEAEQSALEKKLSELRSQKLTKANAYIKAHPKSHYSLALVADRAMMGSYAGVNEAYVLLDPSMRESMEGKVLAERIEVLKRSDIGVPMLNFSQQDTEGKLVHFADFKGKYVLVDFWASWCGPCRAENPNVLKAYNRYKDKNFTVLGVSLDDKAEAWKKAIKDDQMPWTQVSDLKGFQNEVSTYYGINGIPSTLLVDPQGNIVAKDLRGASLNDKLAELLGK